MQRTLKRVALFAAAMLATSAWAQDSDTPAQDAPEDELRNGQVIGDWVVDCTAVTVTRTQCRLIQEQSMRESGELVARLIAAPVADGVILLAQVPMGVYLPGGAVYRFEGNDEIEQRNLIWQTCAGTLCEAAGPLDEAELALFDEHDALLFGYRQSATADPIVLRIGIEGFAEAIAKLRP